MKRIICAVLTAVLLITCASCSSRGTGKSIVYAIDSSPSTLDPQYASEVGAQVIINNSFEGLVRKNDDGEIIKGLATEWSVSDDGLVWTFKLKPDTEWYCPSSMKNEFGQEFYDKFASEKVTANDFVYACRRTVDPSINSPLASRMMVIKGASEIFDGSADISSLGVKAVDSNTVEFTLTEKCDDFLSRLTESEFMPCNSEFFESMNGRYGLTNKHILCNGPFYVSYWDPDNGITMKKNNYYSGEQAAQPSSVTISFDGDANSIYKKLSNSSLTAALLSPLSEIPDNVKIKKEIRNTGYGLIFNCNDSVLSNINIRKALCSSIDRSLFPEETGHFKSETGFVPESCMVGSISYRNRAGDKTPSIKYTPENAKALIDAGLEELEVSRISISILCPPQFDTAMRNQLQKWEKLFGLSVSLSVENTQQADIEKAINSKSFQIALGYYQTDKANAADFLAEFDDGGFFCAENPQYKTVIGKLKTVDTIDDTLNGCYTAEALVLEQGMYFPLYSAAEKFVVSDDSEGISILDSESSVSFINARRFD